MVENSAEYHKEQIEKNMYRYICIFVKNKKPMFL